MKIPGNKRRALFQLLMVFGAFALMVLTSYFFIRNILWKRLMESSERALSTVEGQTRSVLISADSSLFNSYHTIRDMIASGADQEELLRYLWATTDWMQKQEGEVLMYGIYGYIRGQFMDGIRMNPGADYIPQQRPWYQVAVRNPGVTAWTMPYIDVRTGETIISAVRNIDNTEGTIQGVLSMDINISRLNDYIAGMSLSEGGYGILLSQNMIVVAHPDPECRGRAIEDIWEGGDYQELSRLLRNGQTVSGMELAARDGRKSIVFFSRLFNGWYVGLVAPYGSFVHDLSIAALILSALGIILAVLLSLLLLRLEAARIRSDEESRAKTSFLAQMSHEIRTPMNAIIGMSELALREGALPQKDEYVLEIRQAGHNLLSIINDILDFSKVESGKLEIVNAEFSLASVLGDCTSIIRTRLGERDLHLITCFDSSLPAKLLGDEARLRQVMLNLLSNAVKYTPKGTITFSVSGEALPDKRVNLIIKVADTGIGIKPEDMPKLFGEFNRFDSVRNRNVEGTGLGLVISRNLCRLMGGDITVESEYGKGSVFTALIPQAVIDASPFKIEEHAQASIAFNFRFVTRDARILVVDDLPTNLTVVTGLLAPYQMVIDTALSGEESIRLVKENHYDLVFMDHMMPGMDGIEATAQIRAWEAGQTPPQAASETPRQVPIIALTANAISGMREMFLTQGFNGFLSKPIEIAKLDAIIAEWIPREKQIKTEPLETENTEKDGGVSFPEIAGVDTAAGIAATGGTVSGYRKVLSMFRKDAEERLAFLKNFNAAAGLEDTGKNLSMFVTQVHALKGASATLGAAEVSAEAARLEAAGKAKDAAAIREALPGFIERLAALVKGIETTLTDGIENGKGIIENGKPENLNFQLSIFNSLAVALEARDFENIDRLLAQLEQEKFDAETAEKVEAVSDAVLMAEYEKALEIVKKLTKKEK
jgi:signal transduction histidine kinase/DNA-binding NarL/FixJ family response regulator/HPt (histidine-containing phosphotransfer) domain-containing protein